MSVVLLEIINNPNWVQEQEMEHTQMEFGLLWKLRDDVEHVQWRNELEL